MAIRIAVHALTKQISAGQINKAGDAFIGDPTDVTSDCIKSVIEKIGVGGSHTITLDGVPTYQIEIRAIAPTN